MPFGVTMSKTILIEVLDNIQLTLECLKYLKLTHRVWTGVQICPHIKRTPHREVM